MINKSHLYVLFPKLAQFAEGNTYKRTRKGKVEIVRKGKKKRHPLVVGAKTLGGAALGGAGTLILTQAQLVKEARSKKPGIISKLLMTRGGGLKIRAIPVAGAIAGGTLAYRSLKKKKRKN